MGSDLPLRVGKVDQCVSSDQMRGLPVTDKSSEAFSVVWFS